MDKQNSKFLTAAKITRIISWIFLGLMVLGLVVVTGFIVFDQEAFTVYVNGRSKTNWTWIILNYAFVLCGIGLPALFTTILANRLRTVRGGRQ